MKTRDAPPDRSQLVRYPDAMPGTPPASDSTTPSEVDDDDDRALLVAAAHGLADDAAGRIIDTETLKESLERELGPISWP